MVGRGVYLPVIAAVMTACGYPFEKWAAAAGADHRLCAGQYDGAGAADEGSCLEGPRNRRAGGRTKPAGSLPGRPARYDKRAVSFLGAIYDATP